MIVEDEDRMRKLLSFYFRDEGFRIIEAENGEEAIRKFQKEKADLVLLDIMMPLLNGWTACQAIRSVSDVPIIILTARSEDDDKIMGFDLGADDYVTKPFSPRVLVARARALLKRIHGIGGEPDGLIEIDGLRIDQTARQVSLFGKDINLSPREYELLLCFILNQGQVLSREQLLDKVWGFDYDGDARTVDTHIWRLREKLGDDSGWISTIRGCGYRFEVKI